MAHYKIHLAIFLFCCLGGTTLTAQHKDIDPLPRHLKGAGYPFITNYTPEDYGAFDQNWGIAQDSLGIMYFANGDGVLLYDGVSWKLVPLANNGMAYSIACAPDQTIYAGGNSEMGYLAVDSLGLLTHISLLPHLSLGDRNIGTVRKISSTAEGTYFLTAGALYRWTDGKFRIWKTKKNKFLGIYRIAGQTYITYKNKGPAIVENDELIDLPGFEDFKSPITILLPFDKHNLLIGTVNQGLFLYNGTDISPFVTERDQYFKEKNLYTAELLPDSTFALGTRYGGIVFIDQQGNQRLSLNKKKVLTSQKIFALFQDRYGILWAGMDFGIAKIEYPSRFSIFNEHTKIDGILMKVVRHLGKIYVATEFGVYFLDTDNAHNGPEFKQIYASEDFVNDLFSMGNVLLLATNKGIFQLREGAVDKVSNIKANSFNRSSLDTNRIFVGHIQGAISLYNENGHWRNEGNINGLMEEIYAIVELPSGDIWLETNANPIWRISFANKTNAKLFKQPIVQKFTSKNGLPDELGRIFKWENALYFREIYGDDMYKLDESSMRFRKDATIQSMLKLQKAQIKVRYVDAMGNLLYDDYRNPKQVPSMVAWKEGIGKYKVQDLKEERLFDVVGKGLYPEPEDKVIWYLGKKVMARHDLNIPSYQTAPFHALIRNVTCKQDSVVFHGNLMAGRNISSFPILPYKNNNFRFKYSCPSFYEEEKNEFQHYLEGFDEGWSQWSSETQKDYTNLPEGGYTFKVRAKNIYGHVSEDDSYSFTILPPWYRSWWAYLIYVVLGALLIWLYSQWRSRQLHRKNLILEGIIKRRTKEISDKSKLLRYQTERLKEMDTMKTRLFANISHEFRTPLTLIKGPVEKLESAGENKISTLNIKMIRRNANRLLNLVNQLLDLSKLDSGKLELNEAEGDVFKCIRAAASAFSSHAASRQMDYQIKIPSRLLWVVFDRDKLENIVYNLLSNAFKFTPDEGQVIIEAEFRSNRLRLKVSDTGSGIAGDKLPHIFDRFFQVDDSYTKEKAGSGIGLALTKELVELMGGTIFVESELGKGTLFRVVVPWEEIKSGKIKEEIEEVPHTIFGDDIEETGRITSEKKEIKVLIIEDNNDMRHFIREQLENEYNIAEAPNGKEGLKMATKLIPDLIITDLMMPQMDGITLCKKLKTDINTSHIPVIMLTAKAGLENKLEGLETGADEYLTKPFNARELQVRAKNLIAQRQRLRELFSKNISLDPKEITVTSLDEEFLQHFLEVLEEGHTDSQFGVPQMQRKLGMSKTALHSKVKTLTNHPPGELLRNFRLKRATQLLVQKGDNISQVAYDVGFNSLSYFTRSFKKYYGMSPSEFIQSNKQV